MPHIASHLITVSLINGNTHWPCSSDNSRQWAWP